MKPSPKDCLFLLAALAISLVLLMVTRPSRAESLLPRQEGKRTIPFTASFVDFVPRQLSVSCAISESGHQQEVGSVGFTEEQRTSWLDRMLYKRAKQELPEINDQLATFSCSTNVFEGNSMPVLSCSSSDEGFVEEAQRVVREWKGRLDLEKDRLLQEFYKNHKVRVFGPRRAKADEKAQLYIDYASVVKSATPLLGSCAQALFKAGGNKLDANVFTSFLQQLDYVKLDHRKGEYHVHDFLVPTQVLIEKRGDCDSKSAAFCALWQTYSKDAILFISNRHSLIGYKAPANTPLPTIRIKGIDYIACDVSGLHRFPCGNVPRDDYRPIFLNG
jgi:hypothetical protein